MVSEEEKQHLKDIIKRQSDPETEDNRESQAECPNCERFVPHASKFVDVPKNYRTYYCKECKALIYSDNCVHVFESK